MPKWGPNLDQTFEVVALTANFTDNTRIGRLAGGSGVGQLFIYADYVKGDETEFEIEIRFSSAEDAPPGETFFAETLAEETGEVSIFTYKLLATDQYRIPIQFGGSEDFVKVSVRGTGGAGPFTGSADLFFGIG